MYSIEKFQLSFRKEVQMKYFSIITILLLIFGGCNSSNDAGNTQSVNSSLVFQWDQIGPESGFVSSIKFHPTIDCLVWASGDDMSGLYKSVNCGNSWELIQTPKNFSAYSITFDPANPNIIYAPSHFGFGLLKSVDGGITWSLNQAGLPLSVNNRRAFQLAIHPSVTSNLILAVQDGLYRSTNSGLNFTKLPISWGTSFMAAVYTNTGRLVAGAINGVFKYSDDNGSTWVDLFTASLPIVQMKMSNSALYIAYADGTLQYLDLPNFSTGGNLNLGSSGITTDALVDLEVVSGASRSTDTLYLGTSKKSSVSTTRWGLFKSTNGGSTWTQLTNNLNNVSIFRTAVDPNNPNRLLVASSSAAGVFKSSDGGSTFTKSSTGIKALTSLAFAQNPLNPNELALSSSVGLGMSTSFSSLDGGLTWSQVSEFLGSDGVLNINFDPIVAGRVLVGSFNSGVHLSTNGFAGPYTRVINSALKISKIVRDHKNSNIIYALATEGSPSGDIRTYYSNNNGSSFNIRNSLYASDLEPHPTVANVAIATSILDAFVTSDGFLSMHSVGLGSQATAQGALSAVGFNPNDGSEVWVGGKSGGLYKTKNFNSSGTGIVWQTVSSPAVRAMISKILIKNEFGKKVIYISSFGGDIYWDMSGALGLWRSEDDGITWEEVSKSLFSCTSFWSFEGVIGATNEYWGQMWGGGLYKLKVSK